MFHEMHYESINKLANILSPSHLYFISKPCPPHLPVISTSSPPHLPVISTSPSSHLPVISTSPPSHLHLISQSSPPHLPVISQSSVWYTWSLMITSEMPRNSVPAVLRGKGKDCVSDHSDNCVVMRTVMSNGLFTGRLFTKVIWRPDIVTTYDDYKCR